MTLRGRSAAPQDDRGRSAQDGAERRRLGLFLRLTVVAVVLGGWLHLALIEWLS